MVEKDWNNVVPPAHFSQHSVPVVVSEHSSRATPYTAH